MIIPKCPSCGKRISILPFLINNNREINKLQQTSNNTRIECVNCHALIRINPKVIRFLLLLLVPISVLLILIIGVFLTGLVQLAAISIIAFLALLISLIIAWKYLEVINDENGETDSLNIDME